MSDPHHTTAPPAGDLPASETDWLAVRYVLDELPTEQAIEFETRLADDQELRDALVRATQLIESVAAVSFPLPPAIPRRRYPIGRIVAALAATAAIVVAGLIAYRGFPEAGGPVPVVDNSDPAELVMLWTASAESLIGQSETDSGDTPATDSHSALLPPDWLLAAVEIEAMLPSEPGPAGESDVEGIERN